MSFHSRLQKILDWRPVGQEQEILTVDVHTEGEPLRVIIGGFPDLRGSSMLERRRYARERLDFLRTALMWEPRGHADMYGCLIVPPVGAEADFGVLFLHNEGFSTMCGHGIIGVTKVAVESGLVAPGDEETVVKIDTPAGLVTARARHKNGRVDSVAFANVPSFVFALDEIVHVPGLGKVRYDLAFGGAFYAFVQVKDVGLACTPEHYRGLIETGMKIKRAVMQQREIDHPFAADLSFLYGTIFIGPPESEDADSRNVCIFAEGEVDRSPTGTGVSARMAIHHARGDIGVAEPMVIESIIGSRFTGKVLQTTTFGPHAAVIPEVEGRAFVTGRHTFYVMPDDPFKHGFILR